MRRNGPNSNTIANLDDHFYTRMNLLPAVNRTIGTVTRDSKESFNHTRNTKLANKFRFGAQSIDPVSEMPNPIGTNSHAPDHVW